MSFYEERAARTQEFSADRFGMFIHWGIYAIPSRGEWVRNSERISNEDYQKYFDEFNPTNYNPEEWAELAKKAGMKYAVLTTKHHDGFCLFDSQYTDYKATNTQAGRDLVRQYVDAFRAKGIKVGFYYSLLDWYHRDYPTYEDTRHPMRGNKAYKNRTFEFSNYVKYLHNQVRELLTNYGKIDVLWFDFSYDDMKEEKWEASKLVKMIRELQPEIVIDNRLVTSGSENGGKALNPASYAGDFESPEQKIPGKGIVDKAGRPVPWEACMTLNGHWGYCAADKNYKSAKKVVDMLIECVSKGGNLLLNVGPNPKGEIPEESAVILEQVGEWMQRNGESVYACSNAGLAKPSWGRYTENSENIYAHVLNKPKGFKFFKNGKKLRLSNCFIRLKGLGGKIKKARLLTDASELRLYNRGKDAFIDLKSPKILNELDTVIELEKLK